MKTISKKIKSIYLLAIMAVLCVCVAVFPVFKTETVKAADSGLSITGTKLEFSNKSNEKKDDVYSSSRDFALMFQAEITKTLYDSIAEQNATFGMLIGPSATVANIESYDQIAALAEAGAVWVNQAIVGTGSAEAGQLIEFADEETTFTYEAGTFFDKDNEMYKDAEGNALLTDEQWKLMYAVELTAIPFYIVDGTAIFDKTISLAQSAKQEAFDTLLEETALPVSQASITGTRLKNITGMEYVRGYSSDEEIYLDVVKNKFFTNFFRGASSPGWTDWTFMRSWFMWAAYKGASQQLGTSNNKPTYFAGGELTTKFSAETTALSASNFTGIDNIKNLVQGETYRLLYIDNSVDTNKIWWQEYTPGKVFTGYTNAMSTQGETLSKAYTMTMGGASEVAGSYFAYSLSGSTLYMPYSKASSETATYEVDNWDGHYILAGDIIVPEDVTKGTQHFYLSSSGSYTAANTASAPTSTAVIPRQTIGALKTVAPYINQFNTALLNANAGFTGTFDGRGHTIEGSFTRGGIFGIINGGTVKDLNVKANLYTYSISGTTVAYTEDSYKEKAATLAEVIANGALIENVSIELKENAPKTFSAKSQDGSAQYIDRPEMDNVPGIIAAQGIEKSTLRNVIVRLDSLKDAGVSIQNYRAALNVTGCTIDNVFVIGSSYSNMSIKTVENADEGTVQYLLTLSAPEGVEPGTYAYGDNETLVSYFNMGSDMYKFMKNEIVAPESITVKFVAEPATKKFATEADFQAYITSDEAEEARTQLTSSKCWIINDSGELVWKNQSVAGTTKPKPTSSDPTGGDVTYKLVAGSKGYAMSAKPVADASANPFNWVDFAGYSVRVTLANGTVLA